jgi:hypothetical protein
MKREEPSLETLWLKNIRTMDKYQIIDRINADIKEASDRIRRIINCGYTDACYSIRPILFRLPLFTY